MEETKYQKREYRDWIEPEDLISFQVVEYETDLYISADKNLYSVALTSIKQYRKQLETYINKHPEFKESFTPIAIDNNAPSIIKEMGLAAIRANVGPFAAVAGAVAEYVGKDLLEYSSQVIVENGGDIFISSTKDRIIGLYAGSSPLTGKIGLKINKNLMPIGICTSSGTVGHSISFGKADAVVIISKSTSLADAVATASANLIQTADDIVKSINFAKNIDGIIGIMAVKGPHMGVWGDFEVVEL